MTHCNVLWDAPPPYVKLLLKLIFHSQEDKKSNKTEVDDYDKTVNELFFEAKSAKVSYFLIS